MKKLKCPYRIVKTYERIHELKTVTREDFAECLEESCPLWGYTPGYVGLRCCQRARKEKNL